MLITFCLFSECARNSFFFDLKGVYSVNNNLVPPTVPARLRCVIAYNKKPSSTLFGDKKCMERRLGEKHIEIKAFQQNRRYWFLE
jgi:hypothetical protein